MGGLEPEQMPPPYRVVASVTRASLELDARRYAAGDSRRQVPRSRHTHRALRPRSAASRPSGAARSLRTWWRYAGAAMRSELTAQRLAYVAHGRWNRAIAAKRARVRYLAISSSTRLLNSPDAASPVVWRTTLRHRPDITEWEAIHERIAQGARQTDQFEKVQHL